MFRLSKFQLILILAAIVLLRIAIGYHFFVEGIAKLRPGSGFTSKYFLLQAKGPLADHFVSFLDDPHGSVRLCLAARNPLKPTQEELADPKISPAFTYMIWDDFVDRARGRFESNKTGSAEVGNGSTNPGETLISQADQVLANHKELLQDFLDENQVEIASWFATSDRLQGFARDGDQRQQVIQGVESLRDQVATIQKDRNKKFQGWVWEVEEIWDSLEKEVNFLVSQVDTAVTPLDLHRPFDQPGSWQKWIDRIIPWFDVTVGVLLLLGLFTRLAAGAAGLFLASVLATQPPWIAGSAFDPLYLIEFTGCIVLFVAAAGRFGGLDFFLHQFLQRRKNSLGSSVAHEVSNADSKPAQHPVAVQSGQ